MPDFIKPEFFDIFGIFVFMFFIAISLWGLFSRKSFPRWILVIILIIGIIGLMVDTFWVYSGFFAK